MTTYPALADAVSPVLEALRTGRHAVLAGAPGTGKTTVVRALFNELLRTGARVPDDVLVLTPSRDSAAVARDELGTPEDSLALGLERPGPLASALRHGPAARSIHSFAFGLVSARAAVVDGGFVKFISGPDQDNLLASLLAGYETGLSPAPAWPERFGPEVRSTTGFRNQLREILNELMGRGFTQRDVQEAGVRRQRPEWLVVAHVLQDYADQLAVPGFGGVDTAEVFEQARWALADERAEGSAAGGAWSFSAETVPRFVLVDGAQDLPDAAHGMLRDLAALGPRMVFTVSPDSGTQGFRGARGELLDALQDPGGFDAVCTVLDERAPGARGAGAIRAVVDDLGRRISTRLSLGHVPRTRQQLPDGDSVAVARTVGSAADRTRMVAAQLRAWHSAGSAWEECAVVTRTSGTAHALEGELEYLGIPVATGMQALAEDPATAPLLRLVAEVGQGQTAPHGEYSGLVRMLLTGVYIGLDPIALRGVERELAGLLASAGEAPSDAGAQHDERGDERRDVFARALAELDWGRLPAPVARAARLVDTAAQHVSDDPHSAMWALWQAAGVAETWRDRALSHPAAPVGARLDAVLRLMTLAEKDSERDGRTAQAFATDVLDQRFAQDSLARRADDDHVLVVAAAAAAHRAFNRVIVVDLEEGVWPNPRVRGSVFAADVLLDELHGVPPADDPGMAYRESRLATIRDEARLALSAMSRAAHELVLVAIDDGDTQPSVLFDTAVAAGALPNSSPVAPSHPFPVAGVPMLAPSDVASYARHRFETAQPESHDESQWARLLRALEHAGITAADAQQWLDWQDLSLSAPLLGADDTARISPSAVELFHDCQLKWLLTRHGGQSTGTTAQYLGTLVHAIAEEYPDGGLAKMLQAFDERFAELEFNSGWEREREYAAGREMVENLQDYISSRAALGYHLVGVEGAISARQNSAEAGGPWEINGRIDRLERDSNDRLYVVDFKTGKKRPTAKEAAANAQLGTYQVALDAVQNTVTFMPAAVRGQENDPVHHEGKQQPEGEQRDATASPVRVDSHSGAGGGELVFLRYPGTISRGTPANVRSQPALGDSPDPDWALGLVADTAAGMRSAVFTATPSRTVCTGCPVRSSCPAYAGEDEGE